MVFLQNEASLLEETSEEARARRQAYIVNQNQRGLADERKWWQCCFNANRTKKIYPLMVLPRTRVRMSCPNCQALIRTRLEYHKYRKSVLSCAGMFFFLVGPCSCSCCKFIVHYCPECNVALGRSNLCCDK